MSILAFQRLAGELSTDGKILQQITLLNQKLPDTDMMVYFKLLYPDSLLKVERLTFDSRNDDYVIDKEGLLHGQSLHFGAQYFGLWNITVNTSGATQESALMQFYDSNDKLCLITSDSKSNYTFIGELSSALINSDEFLGEVFQPQFVAHFIGYKVVPLSICWTYKFDVYDPLTIRFEYGGRQLPYSPSITSQTLETLDNGHFYVYSLSPFLYSINGETYECRNYNEYEGRYYLDYSPSNGSLFTYLMELL